MQRERDYMDIKIKRPYEAATPDDGYRMLVDRLWPRGIKKENLTMDEWAKCLAPSTEARKAFGHKPENFDTFRQQYLAELDASADAQAEAEKLKELAPETVTLLVGAKDPTLSQGPILKEWLEQKLA